jgi:hypothetical protein
MTENEDNSRVIKLERVDLDFRSLEKNFGQRLTDFLRSNQTTLGLEPEQNPMAAWLKRAWPNGHEGEAIITKLPQEKGANCWMVRPAWSATSIRDRNPIAAGSQVPGFKVFVKGQTLVVKRFDPVPYREPGPYEYRLQGRFFLNDWGEMSESDFERLGSLRQYARSVESRFKDWQLYLDWREKVTVDNSKHRYAYTEWEYWKDRIGVSFYLRERQPVELLKVRLQGQQLLALREGEEYDPRKNTGDDGGGQRRAKVAAMGAYQKITYLEGGERRQKGSGRWQLRKPEADSGGPLPHGEKLAVEVRLTEERRSKVDEDSTTSSFPDAGELMVDVSGELASVRSQRDAIERLEQGNAVNPSVVDWIFNSQKARVAESASPVEATDARLNDGQRHAVTKALAAPDVFFLQGPPGTGKTTVIAELCRQMVKQGKRTLIASQANLAVDNALGSLYSGGRPSPELRPLRDLDSRKELDMDDAYKVFLPSRIVPHGCCKSRTPVTQT